MLQHGALPDTRDARGMTPLLSATARTKNPEVVLFLLEKGADPHAVANSGATMCSLLEKNASMEETELLRLRMRLCNR